MKFKVYGRDNCPFCVKAKTLLGMVQQEYEYIDILGENTEQLMQMFQDNGFKTVPQIYHNDKHIGGFNELKEYLKTL